MKIEDCVVDRLAFEGPKTPNRGYTMRVSHLKPPDSLNALVEVFKNGQLVRRLLWPAYKIYNLQAHFDDIVDGELDGSTSGYKMAGWDGFGCVADLNRTEEVEP